MDNHPFSSIKRSWDVHPEEHRSLPQTGLPSHASMPSNATALPSSSMALTSNSAPFQTVFPSHVQPAPPGAAALAGPASSVGHVRISVGQLANGKLGLVIKNMIVSSINDASAHQWGWRIGDHILQVNGHNVQNMDEVESEIARAVKSHHAVAHPIVFDVYRGAPDVSGFSHPSQMPSAVRRHRQWDCGCSETSPSNHPLHHPVDPHAHLNSGYAHAPVNQGFGHPALDPMSTGHTMAVAHPGAVGHPSAVGQPMSAGHTMAVAHPMHAVHPSASRRRQLC
eukprot:TRINITY_DN27723_c0_g1_i1.p1 TRINITY_DN27723_c0_g1~~TRINITY_DN27723_c0_g1_i1.p1  ORF type:complete len:281 (-),score=33.85 TRINITY_DN27723_c0_g1_i1:302-1144(-)